MTDSTNVTQYEPAVRIAACVLAVTGLLYAARQVTTATWFWGGQHCTTSYGDIIACTGILPVGVMATVVVGVVGGNALARMLEQCWRRFQRSDSA